MGLKVTAYPKLINCYWEANPTINRNLSSAVAEGVTFSDSYVALHLLSKGDPNKFRERERERDPFTWMPAWLLNTYRMWNLICMYMCVYIRCVRLATWWESWLTLWPTIVATAWRHTCTASNPPTTPCSSFFILGVSVVLLTCASHFFVQLREWE